MLGRGGDQNLRVGAQLTVVRDKKPSSPGVAIQQIPLHICDWRGNSFLLRAVACFGPSTCDVTTRRHYEAKIQPEGMCRHGVCDCRELRITLGV